MKKKRIWIAGFQRISSLHNIQSSIVCEVIVVVDGVDDSVDTVGTVGVPVVKFQTDQESI